ncbi:MAG: hypothetical protein JWM90_1410 [Thermoleophilia bacterium]|nr:hypothetical protein [Thermoleophilia bacterium]
MTVGERTQRIPYFSVNLRPHPTDSSLVIPAARIEQARLRIVACTTLATAMLCLLMPATSTAALSFDTSGCTASTYAMGPGLPGANLLSAADCTIDFGSDSGDAHLRMYQTDGAGVAMDGVSDYALGTADWAPNGSLFGACLRAASTPPTGGWDTSGDGSCDADDGDPWNPIPATAAGSAGLVAEFPAGLHSVDLRFGVQLAPGQAAGSYNGGVTIDVIQPGPTAPTSTTLPTISGSMTVGSMLTSTDGSWANGVDSYAYQWRRCDTAGLGCVDIGTNAPTYTLVSADVDATIRMVVTATNVAGSTSATSIPTGQVEGIAPTAGTAAASGTPQSGATLTAALAGAWTTGNPSGTTTYRWRRCDAAGANCVNIPLATASTYQPVDADVDATIRVVVSRTNTCAIGCGSAVATSDPTDTIDGLTPTAGTLTITGRAVPDEIVSANPSGWTTGSPIGADTFQWRRCDASGAACSDIAAATSATYVIQDADLDATLRVVLTRTNSCGTGCGAATLTSGPSAVVAAIASVATPATTTTSSTTGTVAVPSSAQVGDVLVVVITTRDGSDQDITERTTSHGTKYRQTNNSDRIAIALFYRVVTGAEQASYTFGWTDGRGTILTMLAFAGLDTASPIGGYTEGSGTGTSQTAASALGTAARSMLLATFCVRVSSGSYTPPTGMTEIVDMNTPDTTSSVNTEQFIAGGTTGTRQATGPSSEWAAQMVWLRPR